MPTMPLPEPKVRLLDHAFSAEVRSLLYHAYRYEPTFAYLFESNRAGFDHRVRATIREIVNQHFGQERPAIGLLVDDRLVAVALIAEPQRRLEVTESWNWRLRMVLTAGFACTKRYLEYDRAIKSVVPEGAYHLLPLLGVHPTFQNQHLAERLLRELHQWCSEQTVSKGIVLNTSDSRYEHYYQRLGYQELGEVAVGPLIEKVFFHPNA